MTFAEKLAAAKAAPRPSKTVTIALDASVAERRDELAERIAVARSAKGKRLGQASEVPQLEKELEALEVECADSLIDLKFVRLPGEDWSHITIQNPARPGVVADMGVGGYNVNAVTRAAAIQSGSVVEDGEEKAITADEWDDLFVLMSGYDASRVADAVYFLNDYEPGKAVEAGKKASEAIRARSETSS
jgi:hypothetical protein